MLLETVSFPKGAPKLVGWWFPGQQCVRAPCRRCGGSRVMREHGRFTLSYQAGATLAASAVVPSLISSLTGFPLPGFSQ